MLDAVDLSERTLSEEAFHFVNAEQRFTFSKQGHEYEPPVKPIPNVMRIRSTYKVFVRISKSKATVSVYDSLSGEVMTSCDDEPMCMHGTVPVSEHAFQNGSQ